MSTPAAPGAALYQAQIACSRCGANIAGANRFCAVCGTASPLALEDQSENGADPRGAAVSGTAGEQAESGHSSLSVEAALQRNPIFGLLPEQARLQLANSCFRRRYQTGEWVVREGRQGTRAFLVSSGRAHVSVSAGRGRRVLVRSLGPGDCFGEPIGLLGRRRAISVQAAEPLETFVFPEELLAQVATSSPFFREALRRDADTTELEAFLRRASPFGSVHPAVLRDIAANMEVARYGAGEVIFNQGERGDAFYVVRRGRVAIVIGGNQVASLRVGDCFGEAALLTDQPRSATVQAADETEVLRLGREEFQRVLDQYGRVRAFFLELLRRRDLLTPSLARASARTVAAEAAVEAAARSRLDSRPARNVGLLVASIAGLLALLAAAPRGGYLAVPAVALSLAASPLALAALVRELGSVGRVPLARMLLLACLGAISALVLYVTLSGMRAVLERLSFGLLELGLSVLAISVAPLLGRRRAYRLEMDALLAGGAAGLGFGLLDAVLHWWAAGGPAETLSMGRWFELLVLPGLHAAVGALAGVAVWDARERRSPVPPLLALGRGAGLLATVYLPRALGFAPLAMLAAISAAGLIGLRLAVPRFQAAAAARAAALATMGLSGVLSSGAAGEDAVFCWGCGAPAGSGELYCARCGQSLIEPEEDREEPRAA